MTSSFGITVLEHDGTIKYQDVRPTGDPAEGLNWVRPATVHDFDGDGRAEFASSSASHYAVYEGDASIVWSANISDASGIAAGTAFDFLGDGVAEAMYADEHTLFVFDGGLHRRHVGIVVRHQQDLRGAIRDADDRWIQARRIWNQHTYHVTNVREDGTIPQFEPPHHELLNTFRTNAQIENGGLCHPAPQG